MTSLTICGVERGARALLLGLLSSAPSGHGDDQKTLKRKKSEEGARFRSPDARQLYRWTTNEGLSASS